MSYKNYTTEISAEKTIGEIQKSLAEAGARQISLDYQDGQIAGLSFTILVRNTPVAFRLPVRPEGVYKILMKGKQRSYLDSVKAKAREQARRTAWRNVKHWLEAQLALVQAEQAELAEVFLPYAVSPSGRTLYEDFQSGRNLLSAGSDDVTDAEYREV